MQAPRITVSARAWAAIRGHAAADWPREVCGLLVGRQDGNGGVRVTSVEAVTNLATTDDAFELDPAARIALQRRLRDVGEGFAVVGHYHSHPFGEARPSARDLARAEEAGLVWLIVSVGPEGARDVGAFVAAPGPVLVPAALAIGVE